MLMARVEYTAMLLGATGNVGGHILHLLAQSPLCRKVVVVTRRNVAELANPKVQQVVVNMDGLEEELAPHAKSIDIALAAFGVGRGSASTVSRPRHSSGGLRPAHLEVRWQVTVKDQADRIMAVQVPDAPAGIRAAVDEWTDRI